MNKQEMLQALKDLKFNVNSGLVDNETKEKLENLEIDLDLLDDDIFELSNKINDDTNYPTFFALYDEAEISNAKRELSIAKAGLESTKLTIAQVEEYIAYIKREIEENNQKMDDLNKDNLEQGARLRELGITPDEEKENLIRETLNNNRNEITKLNSKNDRARQILAENEKQLTALLENKSDFENKMNNAQINLNNAENLQASRPLVNEAKRNIDKAELEDLTYIKSAMEKEKAALSVNLADEIEKIINDLQNDVISVNNVNEKLENLKQMMPAGYFNADVEERNAELVQNRKVQVELEDKINNLTAKVNNVNNYKYSDAELAREEEKVKVLAVKVQNSNLKIAEFQKSKQQLESDLAEQNKKVESREVENRIIGLKSQLRKAKTADEKAQINKEIEASQKEAWNDLNELTDIKSELELINSSLVTEESNLNRYVKLHQNAVNRKNDINNRLKNNEVQNSYQKRLDEMDLAKAKASLQALKNRSKFISLPILDQVNNLINNNVISEEKVEEKQIANEVNETVFKGKNGEEIKIENPLPFEDNLGVENSSFDEKTNEIFVDTPQTSDLEQNILNALNNDPKLNGLEFSIPKDNSVEEEKEIEPIINTNGDINNLDIESENDDLNKEEKVEEEEKIEEEEKDKKVIPLVGKMKAKFKTASDNLKNKAKDLNFKAKLKKWAKVMAVVAASAILLVSSGKLPQKTLENLQDPHVIEQIDNEELDPNEIIQEDEKVEEEEKIEEEKVEENNNVVEENNNNNAVENKNNVNDNKSNTPNNNSNNNNSNNNNSNNNENNNNVSKPVDDHDNSDEITVPEENNNNNNNNQDDITIDENTPVEDIVEDAIIEDDNNDAIIEDGNEEIFDNEDAIIEDDNNDAVIEDGNEEIFDNEDQFENNEQNNDDAVIEDGNEEIFDNEDQFENNEQNNDDAVIEDGNEEIFDNENQFEDNEQNNEQNNEQEEEIYDNSNEFENNDNVSTDEPVVEEEVYDNLEDVQEEVQEDVQEDVQDNVQDNVQEEVYDNLEDVQENVQENVQEEVQENVQEEVYDNSQDVQDNSQDTNQIEVLPGETYLNDQQEEVYTNGGNVEDAIEKEPSIESIEQGENKDILNVYTNEEQISYNTEIEQLKQLREYYANNTIEEENSMTRSL